jgi:phage terminase large subunit
VGDSTAIWFVQRAGKKIHLIDYYEASGEGFPHYALALQNKSYVYSDHIAPHDIEVRELGTGQSRKEQARALGLRFTGAPKLPLDHGIDAVRNLIPRCWFDRENCEHGIEALQQYRCEYDDRLRTFRSTPLHDWTSHAADAFRYGAIAKARDKRVSRPLQYAWNPV